MEDYKGFFQPEIIGRENKYKEMMLKEISASSPILPDVARIVVEYAVEPSDLIEQLKRHVDKLTGSRIPAVQRWKTNVYAELLDEQGVLKKSENINWENLEEYSALSEADQQGITNYYKRYLKNIALVILVSSSATVFSMAGATLGSVYKTGNDPKEMVKLFGGMAGGLLGVICLAGGTAIIKNYNNKKEVFNTIKEFNELIGSGVEETPLITRP